MVLASVSMFLTALAFSLLIWIIYRRFQVKVDPKLEEVIQNLPGLNCGACGYANCQMLAEAVTSGEDAICPVLGRDKLTRIYKILGKEEKESRRYKAVVLCGARYQDKVIYAEYRGIQSCKGADIYSSYQGCRYGCLGYGDCARVCPVSAIEIKSHLAYIDMEKCIGCGLCVKECPRGIIKLIPYETEFLLLVACSNRDQAQDVKKVCKVGCIGCGVCVRLGPEGGFVIEENLARVNYEKFREYNREELWQKAWERCPMTTIQLRSYKKEIRVK